MKKRTRTTTLVIATAAIMAIATVAVGAPGGEKGKPPPDPERAGTTCVSPWWAGDYKSDDFTIILDANNPDACVDVLTANEGQWHVTVENLDGDGVRSLLIVPRDAVAPGDSCGGERRRNAAVYEPWVLPHPDDTRFDTIPVATVNACLGNADPDSVYGGEFAELVERPGQEPTIEIYPIPTEPHPLAFLVFSQGLKKTDVIAIHVNLP